MSIQETIDRKIRKLARGQQRRVLDYVESLERERGQANPRRTSAHGVLRDRIPDLTLEDWMQARREMWGDPTERELGWPKF